MIFMLYEDMLDNGKILFSIKLVIAVTILLCTFALNLSYTHTSHIKRVIDDDMIQLSSGEIVHVIWVGTPEPTHTLTPVEYYEKEASSFIKKMVEEKILNSTRRRMPCKEYYHVT